MSGLGVDSKPVKGGMEAGRRYRGDFAWEACVNGRDAVKEWPFCGTVSFSF